MKPGWDNAHRGFVLCGLGRGPGSGTPANFMPVAANRRGLCPLPHGESMRPLLLAVCAPASGGFIPANTTLKGKETCAADCRSKAGGNPANGLFSAVVAERRTHLAVDQDSLPANTEGSSPSHSIFPATSTMIDPSLGVMAVKGQEPLTVCGTTWLRPTVFLDSPSGEAVASFLFMPKGYGFFLFSSINQSGQFTDSGKFRRRNV